MNEDALYDGKQPELTPQILPIQVETSLSVTNGHNQPTVMIDGKVRFPCSFANCNKTFSAPHNKLRHEKLHLGIKPFICPMCHKAFQRQSDCKVHIRTHTGERPYACGYDSCGRTFASSSDLFRHQRSHTKSFNCELCDKDFSRKWELKVHQARKHDVPFEKVMRSGYSSGGSSSYSSLSSSDLQKLDMAPIPLPIIPNIPPPDLVDLDVDASIPPPIPGIFPSIESPFIFAPPQLMAAAEATPLALDGAPISQPIHIERTPIAPVFTPMINTSMVPSAPSQQESATGQMDLFNKLHQMPIYPPPTVSQPTAPGISPDLANLLLMQKSAQDPMAGGYMPMNLPGPGDNMVLPPLLNQQHPADQSAVASAVNLASSLVPDQTPTLPPLPVDMSGLSCLMPNDGGMPTDSLPASSSQNFDHIQLPHVMESGSTQNNYVANNQSFSSPPMPGVEDRQEPETLHMLPEPSYGASARAFGLGLPPKMPS